MSARIVATGMVALLVVACAGSSAGPTSGGGYNGAAATNGPAQGGPNDGFSGGGAATAAPSPVAPAASGGTGQKNNAPKPEDYIIKTGLIRVQVADLDGSVLRATDVMHSLGGYLAGSQRTSSGGGGGLASVTYRVPASRFEDALAEARKLGNKILDEHSETTPVGGQIVDLQARIANLKASEKAIQGIMARASSIPDVLTVESRLSDVQGQIEQLSAQLTGLTDQATYSTLTIEFQLPAPAPSATPTPSPSPTASPVAGWSIGREFGQASGALASVGEATATVLIWLFVVVLPIGLGVLLLAILALIGLRLWRRLSPAIRREAGLDPIVRQ